MDTRKSTPRRVRRLSETWLRSQLGKQRPAREEWGDSEKPGLRVRLGKSGTVTWVHYRQVDGKQELVVLGRFPDLGLRAAHERLDVERSRARQGLAGVADATADEDMTVEQLVEKFCSSLHAHRRHPAAARRMLDRYVLRRRHGFSGLKVRDVARPAWRAIVEEVVADGHVTQAARLYRLLGQMFSFGVQLGALETSPFVGLRPRAVGAVEPPPRQRRLDLDELRALLSALDAPCARDARTGRLALKLLLLTGKRTGELVKARWDEVDLKAGLWTIPEANRKAGMHAAIGDEVVPLAPAAAAVLDQLQELAAESPWVLATMHRSKTGHLGATALARAVREMRQAGRLKIAHWTPHDLRRTARSYWSEKLGVPWDLAERLLGHALPKIARTYDVGTFLEQRRAALEKWAVYLEQLQGTDGTVAFLPARGA